MIIKTQIFPLLIILVNFYLLGSGRLTTYVKAIAAQTVLLCFLTISIHQQDLSLRVLSVIAGNVFIKSFIFPWILFKTINKIKIKREIEPLVSYSVSLFIGVVLLAGCFILVYHLPAPTPSFSPFIVSVAFFTILVGFFLIISRNKAITQVIGYITIENGIYLFGVTFMQEAPLFVETGILLDLFVGIFVMQIIMHHIRREFDSLNVKHLSNLKDWYS